MGNTVKGSGQGGEIVHTGNGAQMAKQYRNQTRPRDKEIINVSRSREVREVETDNVLDDNAKSDSKTEHESTPGNHRETDIDSERKARKSDVVLKMTSQNPQDTHSNQGKTVQETNARAKELPLNASEKQSNEIKRKASLSHLLQNANIRNSSLHNTRNFNIKERVKSDTLLGNQNLIQRKHELSLVNEDKSVAKKSKTKSASYAQIHASPVKRKKEKDSRLQTDPDLTNLTKKFDKDQNKVFLQNKKLDETRKRGVVSDLTVINKSLSKKSSKHYLVKDSNGKGRIETLRKTQTQSEPVEHKTVKTFTELDTESLQKGVEVKERENSTMSRVSGHELENELTECPIDIEGEDSEISSSLRSTALDSRLFGSESSIVTHTSIEPARTASSYSDSKKKLKASLIDLYMSTEFALSSFPVLPFTENQSERTVYWPPWMTITGHIETESDLDQAEGTHNLDNIDLNGYKLEKRISKFQEVFFNKKQTKNIYIVGESGTGKTAFCRHLIKQWCQQHNRGDTFDSENPVSFASTNKNDNSEQDFSLHKAAIYGKVKNRTPPETTAEAADSTATLQNQVEKTSGVSIETGQLFDDVGQLQKYEFLFYMPLFYSSNHVHVHDMIKNQYKAILNHLEVTENTKRTKSNPDEHSAFLNELFEKDSEKFLILLDGLDQWRPTKRRYKAHIPMPKLPITDTSKQYTIITTSSLQTFREVEAARKTLDLKIALHGIEEKTSREIVNEVVHRLNKCHGLKKKPEDFISEIKTSRAAKYLHLPYTLEALICLWYNSGVVGNTLCDIFSRLLELQFSRLDKFESIVKDEKDTLGKMPIPKSAKRETEIDIRLPRYFRYLSKCQKNKELIYLLGQSAWLTRKQMDKVFDFSSFENYGFALQDAHYLIKIGILVQQRYPGFSELEHRKTVFFADEKIQEFLASTYMAVLCGNAAYRNIGNIDLHTEKIRNVLHLNLDVFSSVESILEFSNVIEMLCGLYPPTVEQLTMKIYDTVSNERRVTNYRSDLEVVSEDNLAQEVQTLIFDCARESYSVNTDKITLHIGDVFYRNKDTAYLKYVDPEETVSVSINANDESECSPKDAQLSSFIYQSRIFSKLHKLLIRDDKSVLSLQDTESIYALSERSAPTLKVVSYIFGNTNAIIYQRIIRNLDRLLPTMSNLLKLELRHIKLSHIKFGKLSSILAKMVILRELKLADISCEMQKCDGEEHEMDFSELKSLELLDVDGKELPVIGVNNTHIITCFLGNLPQGPELRTFSSLRKAKCLKYFTQKVRQRPPFISKTLIETLNTWHMLERLHLEGVNFGENDFVLNNKLKKLSVVKLVATKISRVTWSHFVESLREMAQSIHVLTRDIHITPLEEDVTRDTLRRPINAETRAILLANDSEKQEAFEHIRAQKTLFTVVFDIRNMFDFTSNPTN